MHLIVFVHVMHNIIYVM